MHPYPHGRPERIRERVEHCQGLLCSLHISPEIVRNVLLCPAQFWRNVAHRKGSGWRQTYVPERSLRKIQWYLTQFIRCRWWRSECEPCDDHRPIWRPGYLFPATAYDSGCSAVRNAAFHRYGRSCLWLDLDRAFESVKRRQIEGFLLHHKILDQCSLRQDYHADAVWLFSRLLTYKGRLQHGASVAPHLFNMLLHRMDMALCEAVNAPQVLEGFPYRVHVDWCRPFLRLWPEQIYTRYGDDLVISSRTEQFPAWIEDRVRRVVIEHGRTLGRAPDKRRLSTDGVLWVPGAVIVEREVRPAMSYLRQLAQLSVPGMDRAQARGHLGHLQQFGKPGRRAARRAGVDLRLLTRISRSRY